MTQLLRSVYFYWLKYWHIIKYGRPTLVLMYHRINSVFPPENKGLTVQIEHFETQIKYLSDHFEVVALSNSNQKTKRQKVILTFDDGYEDNYTHALPILEKYKVPATFFITTQYSVSGLPFWWDYFELIWEKLPNPFFCSLTNCLQPKNEEVKNNLKSHVSLQKVTERHHFLSNWKDKNINESLNYDAFLPMTVAQLQDCSQNPLISIGGHSAHHFPMGLLSEAAQTAEITDMLSDSKTLQIKMLPHFALPHGSYNATTISILKNFGQEQILLANNYYVSEPLRKQHKTSRILIPSLPLSDFKKLIKKYC